MASVSSSDQQWKLWDAANGALLRVGTTHDGKAECICKEVDDEGHRLLQEGCPVVAHTCGLRAVAFSPCGQRLATEDGAGEIILWDVLTGQVQQHMQDEFRSPGGVMAMTFSADGARLETGRGDGSFLVVATPTARGGVAGA